MVLPRPVSVSRRLYALLLRLYPRRFRQEYGREMIHLFAAICRDAYATNGMTGLGAVWARAIGDLVVNASLERGSVVKQTRVTQQTVVPLVIAVLVSVFLGYINLHHDEVQAPFAILLLSTFLFGFSRPKETWQWALIIGLGIPLSALLSLKVGVSYPCRPGHPYSCTAFTLRSALGTLLLLVPALVSTSLGGWVRTRMRRRVNTEGLRS